MVRDKREDSFWSDVEPDEEILTTNEWAAVSKALRARRVQFAVDTADFLIVHDHPESHVHHDGTRRTNGQLAALRRRVDTGGYSIHPKSVAEAMVQRVKRIRESY